MSGIDRAWMIWIMAEAFVEDRRRCLRSSLTRRDRAQSLVEYGFTIITVIAVAVGIFALYQVAMGAMGSRVLSAVNTVR
jgi:hypothetical protein